MVEEIRQDKLAPHAEERAEEGTEGMHNEESDYAVWEQLARWAPKLTLLGLGFLGWQGSFPDVWGGGGGHHGH